MYKLLLLLVVASASAELLSFDPLRYHEDIGIPLAAKIKENEDRILNEAAARGDRIIGGVIAQTNAHPYFGALIISFWGISGNSVCGSSLLSANRAVTAAHCWSNRNLQGREVTVVLGTNFLYSGGIRVQSSQVAMHPQWNDLNLNNDVAVIYLPYNVPLSNSIQPVALPNPAQLHEVFVGEWALAAGFGTTSDQQSAASTIMSEVSLQVISNAVCQLSYGSVFVIPSTLCTSGAGSVGVCSGDSGGPLVINRNGQRILIGISSFAADSACSHGHPSGFARVTHFYNFITMHM